jgi:hypothetical protein
MRNRFVYVDKAGRPAILSQDCLNKAGARVMKTHRANLKTMSQDEDELNKKVPFPVGSDEQQWKARKFLDCGGCKNKEQSNEGSKGCSD